jgi:serine/threonine protein kinase, bacterial
MKHPLLDIRQLDRDLRTYLAEIGSLFRVFDQQDSGCISYGVHTAGRRWFVKYSDKPASIAHMMNAAAFHQDISHPRIPKLLHAFRDCSGYAQVYEWVEGEVLYTPQYPGREGRSRPDSPHFRFRQLPVASIVSALNTVYDVHDFLEQRGYVAVDFYDGAMIYDFSRGELHLCDFDHYAKGPFTLEADRLYGSSRFMAPEEFAKGSRIDRRTNVFTMGAAAFVFLANDGSRDARDWRASEALYRVALRAVAPVPDEQYPSVRALHEAWLAAQH